MNYGYAGTRELNEALVSRFVVIEMPAITEDNLKKLLKREHPALKDEWVNQFAGLYQTYAARWTARRYPLRRWICAGLMSAVELMSHGLNAVEALRMGIINKAFDPFERKLVEDVVTSRIPADLGRDGLFA